LKLLIIDNYDSFTYNLIQLVEKSGVSDYKLVKNNHINTLSPNDFDHVLISPGPGLAHQAGDLMQFIKQYYKEKSFLGVCLGFEAVIQNFNGTLSQLETPLHGFQNKAYTVSEDKIFRNFPSDFKIGHYHSWFVKEENLPPELEVTVRDSQNMIMGVKHEKYEVRGVLFHPESYMTENGWLLISNWLSL